MPVQDQYPSRHCSVRQIGNKAQETPRVSSEPEKSRVFHEVDKHLLIVSDAAAALAGVEASSKGHSTDAFPPKARRITVPSKNERSDSREPRGLNCQFLVATGAFLIVLGIGFCGWTFYTSFSQSDDLSGTTAVSALVERIVAVESNGDPNAKNSRSSALGVGQFLDETWLDLVRAYRPDLARGRSARETLDLRREPKLAREIIVRFVEQKVTMLRQRGLPVTAGTVYLAHFAGGAGAVAILSAPDNSDAALVSIYEQTTVQPRHPQNRNAFDY